MSAGDRARGAVAAALAGRALVAEARAQPRAPAGGMGVGDRFDRGGQFIPHRAGGMSIGLDMPFAPDFGPVFPAPVPPRPRRQS